MFTHVDIQIIATLLLHMCLENLMWDLIWQCSHRSSINIHQFWKVWKNAHASALPCLLKLWPRGTIIFLPKNKDKNLQIVLHYDIIQGCTTIKYYTHVHTTIYQTLPLYWRLMTTATILPIVFNFVTHGDHTYRAIWTFDIGGHLESWVKDGDNHSTFVVVVIMTE